MYATREVQMMSHWTGRLDKALASATVMQVSSTSLKPIGVQADFRRAFVAYARSSALTNTASSFLLLLQQALLLSPSALSEG